ncbi:MAG: hypothetical protein DBY34_02440 [Oscillospiraceae bacterium]|nr:MAG: hypothetical protein DBY34_02440 [Oscillospiraceae bacterium]
MDFFKKTGSTTAKSAVFPQWEQKSEGTVSVYPPFGGKLFVYYFPGDISVYLLLDSSAGES